MALGPDRAQQLEAYLRLEQIADRVRRELGNSTTARQWHELGLAFGGAGSAVIGNELFGSGEHEHSLSLGAAVGLATHFAAHRMTATESRLAARIGQLLVSNDPRVFSRAVSAVSRTPWLMDALRRAGRVAPLVVGAGGTTASPGSSQRGVWGRFFVPMNGLGWFYQPNLCPAQGFSRFTRPLRSAYHMLRAPADTKANVNHVSMPTAAPQLPNKTPAASQ